MINPVHTQLDVTICNGTQDAIDKGFDHVKNGTKPIAVENVVVVKGGTQSGRSTIDFVLRDEHGNKYVFFVTARILASVVSFAE